jgi:hypothetical protein
LGEHSERLSFRRQGIEAIADRQDRLSPQSRVFHAQSLAPARTALPPLRFGATFLEQWPVREVASEQSWRAEHYEAGAPALFLLRDATVHTTAGIVTVDHEAIEQTLIRLNPDRTGAELTPETLTLPRHPITRLGGTCIHLLAGSHENYFHAMMDCLARLQSVPPHLLATADHILVPKSAAAHNQILPLLNLPPHIGTRIVEDTDSLTAETLILPLTIYGASSYHPATSAFFNRLSANVPDSHNNLPRRLYLDRRGQANRRLVNEQEVIDRLGPLGFVPVTPNKLTIPDQIRLFRGAEAIVAPHGAALTNLGFCKPGCAVLELQMDAYTHWGFRHLAALGGLNYDCIVGRALGAWPEKLMATHGLRWMVSVDHVVAAVRQELLF